MAAPWEEFGGTATVDDGPWNEFGSHPADEFASTESRPLAEHTTESFPELKQLGKNVAFAVAPAASAALSEYQTPVANTAEAKLSRLTQIPGQIVEDVMTPANIIPALTPEQAGKVAPFVDPSGVFNIVKGLGGESYANDAAASLQNLTAGLVNFFTTPAGMATLGLGGAPKALQTGTKYAFALQGGKAIPDTLQRLSEAKTFKDVLDSLGELAMNTGMLGAGGEAGFGRPRLATNVLMPTALPTPRTEPPPIPERVSGPVAPEVIDGLVLAKEKLGENFFDQPEEVQQARRQAAKEIDAQLSLIDPAIVQDSRERVAARGQSPPPESAPAEASTTTGVPSGEGGTSSLFAQARREAGVEPPPVPAEPIVKVEETTKDPAQMTMEEHGRYVAERDKVPEQYVEGYKDGLPIISKDAPLEYRKTTSGPRTTIQNAFEEGKPVNATLFEETNKASDHPLKLPEGYVREGDLLVKKGTGLESDPAMLKTAQDAAESIADQVAKGQPTIVREAARDAALDNAMSSLRGGKPPSFQFMRQSAREAAGKAAERQPASLEEPAPGTVIAEAVAPEPARAFDAEAQSVLDRAPLTPAERKIVDAVKGGQYESVAEAADALGISRQAASQSFRSALGKLESMGPGAASALEPLTRYEERRFGTRFVEDKSIEPEIREATGNRYYEPIPNRVTAEEATKIVGERGVTESESLIRDEKNDLTPAVRSTIGQIIIKQLNEQYRGLKESNPVEAERVLTRAADLAEWQMDYGTRLGQGVQSFAMWSRLTPEGKLRTFKRAVDRARVRVEKETDEGVAKLRRITKEVAKVEMSKEDKIAALRKRLLAEKNPVAKRVKKTTLAKLIELADTGLLNEEKVWEAVSKDLGLPQFTPEVSKEITRLAGEIEAAPEGIPRDEATLKLTSYMATQKGFRPSDLPIGIYYSHILSGYNTHIVNALDTGLNVLADVGIMALDHPAQFSNLMRAVIRGIGEGNADALMALSTGRRIVEGKYAEQPGLFEAARFGEKGGVPIETSTRTGRILKAAAELPVAKFLNFYKYVSRLMAASDTVFFRAAEEARSALLAYREAVASGVEKSELRAQMDSLLGYDRIDEFRAQAKAEGFTGAKADARTTELMMQSRPPKLREEAGDYAATSTYNHSPEGALGMIAESVSNLAQKMPVLKLIVPFTRIVANVTNRGLDWTPYGYKRALMGRTGEPKMFGEGRTAELTKATAGTAGLAALAILNQTGAIEVHGAGPSDVQKKRQLMSAGWKPYSIKIGDTYISYGPTPIGLGVSALGNFLDADRYQELKQKDAITRAGYAMSRIASTVFNQSFLSGLSGTFKALSSTSPGEQISELKNLFSRTASAMTTANILKDVNRLFDPAYRDTDSIAEDLIRDMPVARLALRESLNAYGEPALQPSNRFLSTKTSTPEWKIIVDKNLRIPVADETTFTLPEAGYEYQKIAGQGMKKYVKEHLSLLRGMTQDQAQESLTRASEEIFSSARSRIRAKYPKALRQRK